MNIQFEVQKIHSQFGTTEMANYQIQKLFDKLIEEFKAKELPEQEAININSGSTNAAIQLLETQDEILKGKRRVSIYDKENGLPENCDPIHYDEVAHKEIKLAIQILKNK